MSARKLLKILPLLLMASCIPPEPKLDFCQFSVPANLFHCSNGDVGHDLQINDADKVLCVTPSDFAAGRAYIDLLKSKLAQCQGGQ